MASNVPPPIAIIGSACRLPGNASSPSKLWDLLRKPRHLLKPIPPDRFNWKGTYRPDGLYGAVRTKDGYFLEENIRKFDPQFFGIPPSEAENLDPQQRILLENVYETMESAGITIESLKGSDTGVFVGQMAEEYNYMASLDPDPCSGTILTTGSVRSVTANRVSYTFDLRGPSMCIDTACSSSMVAVHLAVASLRRGECKIAFACGTNLNLKPTMMKALSKMTMISPDGSSKMFDESANGYGRGEGTGVVCLKRLDSAIEDGDYIECVIRETGINQDGRTQGITLPSAEAQKELICKTYRSAGLDASDAATRPSFFEAHGTGTLVGDAEEAKAIQAAFFPAGKQYDVNEVLYIGSIKTIIGHTEGTAGIAGLLRASLAVQHAIIPPNLLFTRMSSRVAPWMKHLCVPTAANPWPTLPHGCPRRASINSFGFGGTNVHVIVESFDNAYATRAYHSPSYQVPDLPIYTPFTFSAVSEVSLTSTLETYLTYLQCHKDQISLHDLAWTLQYKRSQFPFRCSIGAQTHDQLISLLQSTINASHASENSCIYTRASACSSPSILGIFTGQGAQYAMMGKELLQSSLYARKIIQRLDNALAALPEQDRPQWKIKEELVICSKSSRVNEALLSQPLTTALQILLVNLLRTAGVRFTAVVGHSSGEIGAAYAAGVISAEDAICNAYYRGLHSKLAAGNGGQAGAMLVAFMTMEDAVSLCNLKAFKNRIVLAAHNSPSIVTISGDADAISEAQSRLDQRGTFARTLQVDKAYHSYHMQPCTEPYRRSLQECAKQSTKTQSPRAAWFSSVFPGKKMASVDGTYWANNMICKVSFLDAITSAIRETNPDLVLEVGPHPALEKPVREILAGMEKRNGVYTGLLRRGIGSIEALSSAVGDIWTYFGRDALNMTRLESMLSSAPRPVILKDLPTYPWHHNKEYWWETRYTRKFYGTTTPNELLGSRIDEGASHEARWRHFLSPKEVPWLSEHRLNGTPVFPAAGYVAMIIAAARCRFRDAEIQVIEIKDLRFQTPIIFPDTETKVETIVSMTHISEISQTATASFVIDFSSNFRTDELQIAARGNLYIRSGPDCEMPYWEPMMRSQSLTNVEPDSFYEAVSKHGFGYTGSFRSIAAAQRKMDFATGEIAHLSSELLFHPATLDCLFQASFLAEGYPDDSAMPNFRVPSLLRRIQIFPQQCMSLVQNSQAANFDLVRSADMEYDGWLYNTSEAGAAIQIEGFITSPYRMTTGMDDVTMYSNIIWSPLQPRIDPTMHEMLANLERNREVSVACDRVATYHLRKLNDMGLREHQCAQPFLRHIIRFAHFTSSSDLVKVQSHTRPEWQLDSEETIRNIVCIYSDSVDMQLTHAMGRMYPFIVLGQKTAFDVLLHDDRLSEYYRCSFGLPECNALLGHVVNTLSHSSAQARILEIGAGTGSATEHIIKSGCYSFYVFTDVTSAFLEPAREKFNDYADRMHFQTFDLEKGPHEQGLELNSFDIVLAANAIHAVSDVKAALTRIRSLLKPGGYLACVELSDGLQIRNTVIFGGLPGWWLHHNNDQSWSPALNEGTWNQYLREVGFSEIDFITPHINELVCSSRCFYAQALDERTMALNKPLASQVPRAKESLMIIGGEGVKTDVLVEDIEQLLSQSFHQVSCVGALDQITPDIYIPSTVLALTDLEEPLFTKMTASKWKALQRLFTEATELIWVTTGLRTPKNADTVYTSMMVGLVRTVRHELRHLRLQLLNIEDTASVTAPQLSEVMLRWHMLGQWAFEGWQDDVLFGHHPELALIDGVYYIPTVKHDALMNARFNSRHRRIMHHVHPHNKPIEAIFDATKSTYTLRPQSCEFANLAQNETVSIKVHYSTLFAFHVKGAGFFFLSTGKRKDGADDAAVVTISESISSILDLPVENTLPCPDQRLSLNNLHFLVAKLLAIRVVDLAPLGGKVLVICSDPLWLSSIRATADECGRKITLITSDHNADEESVIFIHHNTSNIAIKQKIPEGASALFNVSNRPNDEMLYTRLKEVFQRHDIKSKNTTAFFQRRVPTIHSSKFASPSDQVTLIFMKEIIKQSSFHQDDNESIRISPQDLVLQSFQLASSILDWTETSRIPCTVQPATFHAKFSPRKTYLIVGSSDIAQSIGEWMIRSGARFLVMVSRRLNTDKYRTWLREMAFQGATVQLYATDISSEASVSSMLAAVKTHSRKDGPKTPPFGGVIHLGLQLKDGAFSTMSFEDFQVAVEVKASGSLNLHKKLYQEPLDFFILTSSFSYVVGNPGQANYNCGNAYMVGLANYRRSLGLPASVVHLGAVAGMGYIARTRRSTSKDALDKELRKLAHPISERDLHQIFAEAVLASPANSGREPEIVTGIKDIQNNKSEQFPGAKEPMFAHITSKDTGTVKAEPKARLSPREQLTVELSSRSLSLPGSSETTTHESIVFDVVHSALISKLKGLLQMDDLDDCARLTDLGIDSLVASEISSWARKELSVQIPNAIIFEGASTRDLVEIAVRALVKEWALRK